MAGLALVLAVPAAQAQLKVDEQKQMRWHRPDQVVQFYTNAGPAPVTVATKDPDTPDKFVSLDEAIQLALQHSEVVRVLTGVSATSTGSTIYDTAIANTSIDQAVGRFDPVYFANSTYRKTETPFAAPTIVPFLATIQGAQVSNNQAATGLEKTNRLGGTGQFSFTHNWNRDQVEGNPVFNPSERSSMELSYTQPLLAGGGRAANEAPIVIARLDLDRSYFQYKNSVQELVRSVVAGYWSLVASRTNLWAREQQLELLKFSLERVLARQALGLDDIRESSQSRVAYANIRASVISAQADVLQRESALRNALGLPPEDGNRFVPSTPPTRDQVEFDWHYLFDTAQQRRPDLIELNLILQADLQRLVQSRNLAKPTLNATALQRWNGLRGTLVNGISSASSPGENTDWSLGVTFSVPVGLRAQRAQMRSAELLIARDRSNIQQGLHATRHGVATNLRSLDSAFLQYEAFQETRAAAYENIGAQWERQLKGAAEYLVFVQAVSDWGNAVSSEAAALAQYNTELVNIETETGTILETHAVYFVEERFASIGPLGRKHKNQCYPKDLRSLRRQERYPDSGEAAEQSFDLEDVQQEFKDVEPLDLGRTGTSLNSGRPRRAAPGSNAAGSKASRSASVFRMRSLDKVFR